MWRLDAWRLPLSTSRSYILLFLSTSLCDHDSRFRVVVFVSSLNTCGVDRRCLGNNLCGTLNCTHDTVASLPPEIHTQTKINSLWETVHLLTRTNQAGPFYRSPSKNLPKPQIRSTSLGFSHRICRVTSTVKAPKIIEAMPKEMLKISSLQPNEIGPLLCIEFLIAARTTKILVSPADHAKDKLKLTQEISTINFCGSSGKVIRGVSTLNRKSTALLLPSSEKADQPLLSQSRVSSAEVACISNVIVERPGQCFDIAVLSAATGICVGSTLLIAALSQHHQSRQRRRVQGNRLTRRVEVQAPEEDVVLCLDQKDIVRYQSFKPGYVTSRLSSLRISNSSFS